jgi:hypothetical protein
LQIKNSLVVTDNQKLVLHPFPDFFFWLASLSNRNVAFFERYEYVLGDLTVPVADKLKGVYVAI